MNKTATAANVVKYKIEFMQPLEGTRPAYRQGTGAELCQHLIVPVDLCS